MANLSVSQAIALIKQPKNGREIVRARFKRYRNQLHTETETDIEEFIFWRPQHVRFLSWVKNILDSDENFKRFQHRYRPPLATNEFTDSIFSQFEKVFESENKYEKFNFTDNDLEPDFQDYRKAIGDFTFWETQGYETMRNSIDNVLVCDLPRADQVISQESSYPTPYYHIVDIDDLIDIDNIRIKGPDNAEYEENYFFKTGYVIFHDTPATVCVFDDGFFRTFKYGPDNPDPILVTEVGHDLGYCPARSFWTTPMNSKTTILKRSPITNSLSKLDELLFKSISTDQLKDYASYPIFAVYRSMCTYKNKSQNMSCHGGYLYLDGTMDFNPQKSNGRCPKCSKIKNGPGNILEIVPPQAKDDVDLMANPVKIIPADKDSVELLENSLEDLKMQIFTACVGGALETDEQQAKNKDQVKSGFEGKTNKLLWIKKNFESIHCWAMDTIGRLRYGDKYLSGTIDYGDVFFQKDESVETEEYATAKEQEFPAFDLAIRRDKINETRYRNNPDMIERLRILSNLDPFPDDDMNSLIIALDNAPETIDPVDVCIKINFDRFIKRFEREQASLLLFGSALDFDKKIMQIQDVINGYAVEYLTTRKINAVKYPLLPPPPEPVVPIVRAKGAPLPVT